MKKLLLALPIILLVATSCSKNTTTSNSGPGNNSPQNTQAVDTSNWKTYTSQKYGFQFLYPADWVVNDQSYTYKGQDSLGVVFSSSLISGVPGAIRDAYFYTGISKSNGAWQHKEGINLSLLLSDGGPVPVNVSQQYLESRAEFKIAELIFSSAVQTSDWKTYTSKELEFQVKHPSDWNVDYGKDFGVGFSSPKDTNGFFSSIYVQRSKTQTPSPNQAGVGPKVAISLTDGTPATLDQGRSDGVNGVSEQYINFDHNGYAYYIWYQIHKSPLPSKSYTTPAQLTPAEVQIRDLFLASFKFTK